MSAHMIAYEEPQLNIRLERDADEGEGPLQLTEQVLIALETLMSGWLEPVAWEMLMGCYDTELLHIPWEIRPPQPYWLLCEERIPHEIDISPHYRNHTSITAPVLSTERVCSWIAHALAQECADAPRFIPCWREFWTLAMRVLLPPTMQDVEQPSLSMDCYAGTISMPVERLDGKAWISGRPKEYVVGPPVAIDVDNTEQLLFTIDLAIYWSLWISDPAGRAQVDAAVERVLAMGRGWRRSED